MKWTAGNRDNIEDVRASSGGGGMRMGGLGIGGLLVVLILSWLTGVDFLSAGRARRDSAAFGERRCRGGERRRRRKRSSSTSSTR